MRASTGITVRAPARLASVWLVVAGAVGCGAGAPAPSKARPAPVATASADPVTTPEPEPVIAETEALVASTRPPSFDPAAAAEAARHSAVLRAMPERCSRARFAMRAGDMLGTELRTPVDVISTRLLHMPFAPAPPDPKPVGPNPVGVASGPGLAALALLGRGLEVVTLGLSTSEIAVCANTDERDDVVAMALDMTGWGHPADALARAFRSKTRHAPAWRSKDGVVYLQAHPQNGWVAVVGSELLVVASTVDLASAALKRAQAPLDAASVDARFAPAGGASLWFEAAGGATISVRRDGERHHVELLDAPAKPGAAADLLEMLEKQRSLADRLGEKAPIFAPLVPALKQTAFTLVDGRHRATTTFGVEWLQLVRELQHVRWDTLLDAIAR